MRRHRKEQGRAAAERPNTATPAAQGILALQQSAGNHAVAGMLARKQTQPTDTKAKKDAGTFVGLEDEKPIPVESVSFGGQRPVGSGVGPGEKVVRCTSLVGEHSALLLQWASNGKHFEEAVIKLPGLAYRLRDAFVASYGSGSQPDDGTPAYEHWSLDYGEIEFENDSKKAP